MTAAVTLQWSGGERTIEGTTSDHAVVLAKRAAYGIDFKGGRIEIKVGGEAVQVYDSTLPNTGPGYCHDCGGGSYWHAATCSILPSPGEPR